MQVRFFHIPAIDPRKQTEELNQFLKQHQIVRMEREFVSDERNSFWTVCVTYVGDELPATESAAKPAVDYREVLNEADFAVFAKLRTLRKSLSEQHGVPAYALFTNQQLATMVTSRVISQDALKSISGVGEAKSGKYGDSFLAILMESFPSASPLPQDCGASKLEA